MRIGPYCWSPAPERAELRETHISWVVLEGDRAYKIKKPIRLPFLDYGSLERRHALCREEVRLNRRLAPDVYLGVGALVPDAGGVRPGPEDAPGAVEYVVVMRRYDEAQTSLGGSKPAAWGRTRCARWGGGSPSSMPAPPVQRTLRADREPDAVVAELRSELDRRLRGELRTVTRG